MVTGGCSYNIKMTFLLAIMCCLLGLGSTQGNTLSFLSSPGFVRVVGYEGSYNLNIDIKVGPSYHVIMKEGNHH